MPQRHATSAPPDHPGPVELARQLGRQARSASRRIAALSSDQKASLLRRMAHGLHASRQAILEANAHDIDAAQQKALSRAMIDRLMLSDERIDSMIDAIRTIADLRDPVGEVLRVIERPNGLRIKKVRVPLGVIAIIYESRPNVTADAAALCLMAGNAVILRGGSEALRSNQAILNAVVHGAGDALPADALQLVPISDRAVVRELLTLEREIDLVIPRGGEGLIRMVAEHSRVPVMKHYNGVCHVFVDCEADLDMAEAIVLNAKCSRPGVCNAMETLLVHEDIVDEFLPRVVRELRKREVEVRGDERACEIVPDVNAATDDDWTMEYLDLILAVRVVRDLEQAIEHINAFGSHHSDAIVTRNEMTAERFLREIDSAAVYVNASTRFTDGGEFGMGAEIGISTDKLHARGPCGVEELTTYKYVVRGDGQVR